MGVKDIQRAQFLALCEEYKDKKIYLKSLLTKLKKSIILNSLIMKVVRDGY